MENDSCPECGRPYGVRKRCYYCHGRPSVSKTRGCIECGEMFVVPKLKNRSLSARCLTCRRKYNTAKMAAWRKANPEKSRESWQRGNLKRNADPIQRNRRRESRIRRTYGIEPEEYDRLFEGQNGQCAICNRTASGNGRNGKHLHVDHCHDTDRVRGLLCGNCNTMLGLAGDSGEVLAAAIKYLKEG